MPRYECPKCNHRWWGQGRKPGGEVYCPKCGELAYTYAKAVRPMKEKLVDSKQEVIEKE